MTQRNKRAASRASARQCEGTPSARRVAAGSPLVDRRNRTYWLLLPALVAIVLVAYHPAWHGGVLWDDASHLTRSDLQSADGLRRIWFEIGATQQYYPVVHSVFWLEHRLWGDETLGYHLLNILLHAASAFLLVLILRRLRVPWPALAAIVFALHPIEVESVAWMTELKNTLSGALSLGAALAYLHFDGSRRKKTYALALALFVLALLSKTVVATLPGALLVIFWWQRGRLDLRRDVAPLLPFVVLGAAGGLFTAWVERTYIGASGADYQFGAIDRVLIAGRVVWFYLVKLLWPSGYTFVYPRWTIDHADPRQYVYPVGVVAVAVCAWAMRRRSRAPLAVTLLFVGMLFPVLGFVNVYPFRFSFVADHFQYLAGLAVIAGATAALATLARHLKLGGMAPASMSALAVGLPLAFLTFAQSGQYTDAETLYRATLARNPDCWLAHSNLGMLYLERGQIDEGFAHVTQAVRLEPDVAEAHTNLGFALQRRGRVGDAIAEYLEALRLNPMLWQAHNDLGMALLESGRIDEAVLRFEEALRLRPDYPEALTGLGVAMYRAGRVDRAIALHRQAIAVAPRYATAHFNLALTLHRTGRLEEAAVEYEETLRLQEETAKVRGLLGECLERLGRLEAARDQYQRALALDGSATAVSENLARVSGLLSQRASGAAR